jgi:16S rRNA (adenine(1408)-N(1))-methyltransferase
MALARADQTTYVVGVDANAAGMLEASRKAARPAAKGGQANALFVVAAVEALPPELEGFADEVRISFPWGSLLRGVLGLDDRVLRGIRHVAAPGAAVTVLVSVTGRDRGAGVTEMPETRDVERAWRDHGFSLVEARPATQAELDASHSTWAKRLRAGADRPVMRFRFERA